MTHIIQRLQSDITSTQDQNFLKVDKINHHSISVNWSEIDIVNINYDPTVCFNLKSKSLKKDGGENIQNIYTGYAKKYSIDRLDSGKCYQFRLLQVDGKELSDWITCYTTNTPTNINDIVKLVKRQRKDDLIKVLLNGGTESGCLSSLDAVNDAQISPLMQAAQNNWIEGVKLLVDINNERNRSLGHLPSASVNYVDPVNNRSALMVACRHDALKVIELLSIDCDADWSLLDTSGLSALHWLVDPKSNSSNDFIFIVLDWIRKNEDKLKNFSWKIKSRNTGWSVLHRACARGAASKTIERLIKVCDINEFEKNGQTPLMLAVLGGHQHVVECLLANCGKQIAETRASGVPSRQAGDLITSAPKNKRQLRETFEKYN